MSWQDRLSEAAYTPPSGARVVFTYEELRVNTELKGSRFDFPGTEGTYVQATGASGREFPLRVYFNGEDHDTEAAAFFNALRETGEALLEHPTEGRVTVVPLGRVSQRNDLVKSANETVIDVVLWETIGAVYPTDQTDPAGEVLASVADFKDATSRAFADTVNTVTGSEIAELTSNIKATVAKAKKFIGPIADTVESIETQFADIADSINDGIDVLIGQPLTLAFQVVQLIHAPARAAALWQDKISAYGDLAKSIVSAGERIPTVDDTARNLFAADDTAATSAATGAILSAVDTEFKTQPEAIEAAQAVIELVDSVVAWREANFTALSATDTGETYQQMQAAASLCAGYLIQISFTLYQERTIITHKDRTIVDLCAELYGDAGDENLNFFINSNAFTGDEILEVPKGKRVKYYV